MGGQPNARVLEDAVENRSGSDLVGLRSGVAVVRLVERDERGVAFAPPGHRGVKVLSSGGAGDDDVGVDGDAPSTVSRDGTRGRRVQRRTKQAA